MPTENTSTFQKFARRHRHALMMGSAAAIVVVSMGAFALLPPVQALRVAAGDPVQMAQNTTRAPRQTETAAPFSFADLVERVSPAVVTITSESMTTETDDQEIPAPFRDFFNQFGQGGRGAAPAQPRKAVSAGSGFIIDKAGYIVTNNHVIDHSSKITVTLTDKRKFTAKLIGTDPATDVALLKIESSASLPIVEFGNDRAVRVGDWVVAVGNPFGLSNSVTAGIVSSLGRDLNRQGGSASNSQYNDFIQIDAPINQGNSGGPTFDLRGQVIGMNSMIYSPSGGSVGIGFAIPATTIHDVVAQLRERGHVNRGYLGVSIQNVTPEVASALGMKEGAKGALVAAVVADGPAAKGGFQQGDIITAINGQGVEDNTDLTRKVALVASGQTATFSVSRDGKALQLHATIGARPDEEKLASNAEGPKPESPGAGPQASAMGLGLATLTPQARRSRRLDDDATGVLITKVDPDSNAADQGLEAGDVVLKVGSRNVASPADVQSGVAEAKRAGRKSVLLLVARAQGQTGFVAVDIGA